MPCAWTLVGEVGPARTGIQFGESNFRTISESVFTPGSSSVAGNPRLTAALSNTTPSWVTVKNRLSDRADSMPDVGRLGWSPGVVDAATLPGVATLPKATP